jgi:hypothetical protein
LSRMDRALSRRGSQCNSCAPCDSSVCEPQPCGQCEQSCGRRQRYTKPCDPCGFDLWPCVGECSNMCPSGHGQGHAAPPAAIDPGLLRPYDERQIDPFMDDPDQPPRPPMSPTGVRGARLHPAIQHRYSR